MARKKPSSDFKMGEIIELRNEAGLAKDVSASKVAEVVIHCNNDFDLALTALTMEPRPAWVSEMLGLHPERAR